ncbi:MAG: mannosyltransferase family protein [Anaerolineae bacterium]
MRVPSYETARAFTRRDFALLAVLFVLSRLIVVAAGVISMGVLPSLEGEQYTHLLDGGPALDMWYRQDAGFYTSIATYGYKWQTTSQPDADMAFMPAYPALVRALSGLNAQGCAISPYWSTCTTAAGVALSNAAFFGALLLIFDLARRRFDKATAWRAAFLVLVSPITIYLSGVYTEGLFLFLTALTFWLVERDRAGLALLAATLAALTRSVGVALYPALLLVGWRTYRTSPAVITHPRLKGIIYGLGAHLPLIAFAAYILFMGVTVGDPLAYFSTYETSWGREAGSIVGAFTSYFSGEQVALLGWRLSWLDLILTIVSLGFAVLTFRTDAAWGAFALFAILIPAASGTLVGMPRFVAVIMPFYIMIPRWISTQRGRWALAYGISGGLALLMLVRFVTWRWIA